MTLFGIAIIVILISAAGLLASRIAFPTAWRKDRTCRTCYYADEGFCCNGYSPYVDDPINDKWGCNYWDDME